MESDFDLLTRYHKTRDPLAFTELTRRYRGLVFAAARRVTNSHHDAEDITQACFLDLAQKSDVIRESVPAWLHQQATYRAIDVLRRSAVRQRREQEGVEPPATSDVPQWDQVGPLVDEAINELPDDLRLPVILYYLQEFTQDEIAAMLKLSRHTVARRLRLGIVALRDQVGKCGLFISAGVLGILLKEHAVEATPTSLHVALAKIGMLGVGPRAVPKSGLLYAVRQVPAQIGAFFGAVPLVYKVVILVMALSLAGWQWAGHSLGQRLPSPYAALKAGFVPYVDNSTPFGFPQRVRHMTEDLHGFWTGERDLFFAWAYAQRPEWFADTAAEMQCHGAIDFPNVGIQPSDPRGQNFRTGLIDFDDATWMPFQAELLQAMVSVEIAHAKFAQPDPQALMAAKARLFESYRNGLSAADDDQTLENDAAIAALKATANRERYEDLLRQYTTSDGHFRLAIRRGKHVRELLESAADLQSLLAAGLKQAMKNNPDFAAVFQLQSEEEIHRSVRDAALRIQLSAGGSNGLSKYLLLLRRPLKQADHDVIIYFKQQIPSPLQRADIDMVDDDLPGRRAASAALALTHRRAASQISWCEIRGGSYTVQIHEPWTQGIGLDRIFKADQLVHASGVLGYAAGASHAGEPETARALSLMTPELFQDLHKLSSTYAERLRRQYQALLADPAARHDVLAVRTAETTWINSGENR